MSNIEEKVKKIISEQLGVEDSEITNTSNFVEDLGADSLDSVELVMALEEEFDVEIAEWLAFKFSNFGIRCLSGPVVKPIMWISSMCYNQ